MHFSTRKKKPVPLSQQHNHLTDRVHHLPIFITINATMSTFFSRVFGNEKSPQSVSSNGCCSIIAIYCLSMCHKRNHKSIRFDMTKRLLKTIEMILFLDATRFFILYWTFFLSIAVHLSNWSTTNNEFSGAWIQAYRIPYIHTYICRARGARSCSCIPSIEDRDPGCHCFWHLSFPCDALFALSCAMCNVCRRENIFNSTTRFLKAQYGIPCHIFHRNSCRQGFNNVEQRTMNERKLYLLHSDEKNDGEWWLLLSLLRRLWDSKWFSIASNKTMEWL